ncbi:hypothetical protein LCD36_25920, partial [Saccharopolyspora sp. 6T]
PPDTPAQAAEPAEQPDDDDQPAAVQPAKPIAPRPEQQAVQPTPVTEDGPPCPSCGTPNPTTRRFCVRCASALNPDPDERPTKIRWRKRPDRGRLRWLWRRLAILGTVLAVVLGGYLLWPFGTWLVQDVLDKTLEKEQITPSKTTASIELPGHPAGFATDGITNQYWGTPGPGEWIEFEFERPRRLLGTVITVGPSTDVKKFPTEAHPSLVEITTTDSRGRTETRQQALPSTTEATPVEIRRSDVVRIRLKVLEARGLTAGKHVALAEVEFFVRK